MKFNVRRLCFDILFQVFYKNKDLDQTITKKFTKEVSSRDRRFCYEVCYGTVRWKTKLEWIASQIAKRDTSSIDDKVLTVLALSIYQILYMDNTPARAIVHQGVELTKSLKLFKAKDFVNAILRSATNQKEFFRKIEKRNDDGGEFSLLYSYPAWMVDRWLLRFGKEKTIKLLTTSNAQAPIRIRINQSQISTSFEEFSKSLLKKYRIQSFKRPLPGCFQLKNFADLPQNEEFRAGKIYIQDEASQLIAHVLGPAPKDRILDLCSAPGGKLSHIYDLVEGDLDLTGIDRSQEKIALIEENLSRMNMNGVNLLVADASTYKSRKKFDKILLDAPCSSLGVLRRHPGIKWRAKKSDIDSLAEIQYDLLKNASKLLRKGGELVYSVCSFEPEETSLLIEKFLEEESSFSIVKADKQLPPVYRKYFTKEGWFYSIPIERDDLDGFFLVKLKRTK